MSLPSTQDFALRCTNVGKTFFVQREQRVCRILAGAGNNSGPSIEVLRDISLTVPRGEIVGILGRNGAGKSTLLRLLGRVYTPTVGCVEASGQVAGLFELGGMGSPNHTGREYATRYLTFMGVKRSELPAILEEIADFSELGAAFNRPIRTYSSGMGARLYFAVATARQHEIYLIDELLAVGDEHFQAKCWRRMRDRLLHGASGILVTHDWAAILKLCKYACVLENGRFSFQGSSDVAVVNYLGLSAPDSNAAKFSASLPQVFTVRSGEDARLRIPVEIREDISVTCAISIEALRIGDGWEIMILTDSFPVGESAGNYEVEISIPALPLVSGEYSLNLFLARQQVNDGAAQKGLDARSWTYGNGLTLLVEGEPSTSAVKLPFEARRIVEDAP